MEVGVHRRSASTRCVTSFSTGLASPPEPLCARPPRAWLCEPPILLRALRTSSRLGIGEHSWFGQPAVRLDAVCEADRPGAVRHEACGSCWILPRVGVCCAGDAADHLRRTPPARSSCSHGCCLTALNRSCCLQRLEDELARAHHRECQTSAPFLLPEHHDRRRHAVSARCVLVYVCVISCMYVCACLRA